VTVKPRKMRRVRALGSVTAALRAAPWRVAAGQAGRSAACACL